MRNSHTEYQFNFPKEGNVIWLIKHQKVLRPSLAPSGIGAVYADRFAKRGFDLVLVARNKNRLGDLSAKLAAKYQRKVDIIPADLTSKDGLTKIEDRLRTDTSITTFVNNAGFGAAAGVLDSKVDDLEEMIFLNVTALTRLTAAALPGFVQRGHGLLINISSIVALAPELLNGVYSGTKAYVVNLTQAIHKEVGGKGVQVRAVLPGAIATEFWDRAGLPIHNLPDDWVMSAEELVDAALAGLDQRELVTIPSLPDAAGWRRLDAARLALGPYLSRQHPADRYFN